jgi:hypothetical protein
MTKDSGIRPETGVLESSDEAETQAFLQEQLVNTDYKISLLAADCDPIERARLQLDKTNALLGLEQKLAAWDSARQAFDVFIEQEHWSDAIEACDMLYQAEQPASITALIHGVWLSVTFPVDPEHSIVMLSYIVDETPNDSDGAAVAAVTAHYIVGLRATDKNHDSLSFLTTNLLAKVAQRHGDVKSQEALNFWMEKMDLNDPQVFLPRMSKVLSAIVHDDAWWFDRDALRQKLPVN